MGKQSEKKREFPKKGGSYERDPKTGRLAVKRGGTKPQRPPHDREAPAAEPSGEEGGK